MPLLIGQIFTVAAMSFIAFQSILVPHSLKSTVRPHSVMIISICSLRQSALFNDGQLEQIAPNISRLLKRSFVYHNAYATYPYTHLRSYLTTIPLADIPIDKYRTFGRGHFFEIIKNLGASAEKSPPRYFLYSTNDMTDFTVKYIVSNIARQPSKAYLSFVHFKDIHRPYFDPKAPPPKDEKLKALLSDYLHQGRKYPKKIPLFRMLFSDDWFLKNKLYSSLEWNSSNQSLLLLDPTREQQIVNIHDNPEILNRWIQSSNYKEDLLLLKEIYKIQLSTLDKKLEPLFNEIANGKNEDTIIIFMGDHGEAFMEHDRLFHATDVYDEMLGVPLAIHYPNQFKQINVFDQISFSSLTKFIRSILVSSENPIQPESSPATLKDDYIISRNCARDAVSVRYANKWKLIFRALNNSYELYDLKNDPDELLNLYSDEHPIASKLKLYMIEHQFDPFNSMPLKKECSI